MNIFYGYWCRGVEGMTVVRDLQYSALAMLFVIEGINDFLKALHSVLISKNKLALMREGGGIKRISSGVVGDGSSCNESQDVKLQTDRQPKMKTIRRGAFICTISNATASWRSNIVTMLSIKAPPRLVLYLL